MSNVKIHNIKELHKGKLFSFVTEDVTLPNGCRAELALVRHPGSTAVVPLLDDNQIIMERQYRHSVGVYLLEVPAGTMEPGESPRRCAKRELEEETGFIADEFVELVQTYILPGYSDEKVYIYLARGLAPSKPKLDKDEIIEVVNYPFEQTLKMIDDGRIIDGLTVLAIQRAWFYLKNER